MICNDAGPGYASSMGWESEFLSASIHLGNEIIYVVDNRISESECQLVEALIIRFPKVFFLLKVVDPYYENTSCHFFYYFLAKSSRFSNAYLYSVYEPKELVKFISELYNDRIIYIPYPYDEALEISLSNVKDRKKQVLITGAVNRFIYPYRAAVWKSSRRLLTRFLFPQLNHPGYPELDNSEFKHQIIGSRYIEYLSNYRYMLVCPTRASIELLKFQDCAYAGCLPVGIAPDSFPPEIKSLILPMDAEQPIKSFICIVKGWSQEQHIGILRKYRLYFRNTRSKGSLNAQIIRRIEVESSIRTS